MADFSYQMELPLTEQAFGTESLPCAPSRNDLGAVYTKVEIVNLMLDLIGYVPEAALYNKRILEPSFGGGAFLFKIVERLLTSISCQRMFDVKALAPCIFAVEYDASVFATTKCRIHELLVEKGLSAPDASFLTEKWLHKGDFLLTSPTADSFHFIIGNPPYIRLEKIPEYLQQIYRARFKTFQNRADLYVAFYENALRLLHESGKMAFICTDRWMKNAYGKKLREYVASRFHVDCILDIRAKEIFESKVTTYPAITVIEHKKGKKATRYSLIKDEIASIKQKVPKLITADAIKKSGVINYEVNLPIGGEVWTFEDADKQNLFSYLERAYPLLEEAGCKVGIGVATGADDVYLTFDPEIDVEASRLLPILSTKDIIGDRIAKPNRKMVNPWSDDGVLVNLEDFPKLGQYLGTYRELLSNRHCGKKNPARWYRTIDRVIPRLQKTRKLLIPDIKSDITIVYDEGQFYPHHNFYYITSYEWDLRALKTILLSDLTRQAIARCCTRMNGGCLRFQAQYLRRLRIPHWNSIPDILKRELIRAHTSKDAAYLHHLAELTYKISYAYEPTES